jgi:lysophospholipase L1-like esterase
MRGKLARRHMIARGAGKAAGLAAMLVCGAWAALPAAAETILFVGNSFTAGALSPVQSFRPGTVTDLNASGIGGVPALFKTFTAEAGLNYEVSHETVGGVNLDYHYAQKAQLLAHPWDHVVLQPYSTLDESNPGDASKVIEFSARLAALFQAANPVADIRIVATWARADQTYTASGHWYGKPIDAMAMELRAACDQAARNAPGIRAVIPVGQAWNLAIETLAAVRNPYLEVPQEQINLWAGDNYHASAAGYYLEALVIFGSVTGSDPRLLGAPEQAAAELGIVPAQAVTLQRVAYETLAREAQSAPDGKQTAAAPGDGAVSAAQPGVSSQPCRGVPIEPTAAHKASANVYETWMHEWLSLDWGQRCRYQAENSALPPASARRVVFIGDSITEGWKTLDPAFFSDDVIDRGISGQTTAQMLLRFRGDVIELRPALVHIMAGTNDVAGNGGPTSLASIEGNIATMVELAQAHGIGVILASVPPAARFGWRPALQPLASIAALNHWLRQYARLHHLTYVDYHSALQDESGAFRSGLSEDGVHPNAAGFALMQTLAEPAIAAAFGLRQGAHRHRGRTAPAAH